MKPLPRPKNVVLSLLPAVAATLAAAPSMAARQLDFAQGVFFEAESLDRVIKGKNFASVSAEPLASGSKMLTEVYKDGAAAYDIRIPESGTWRVWMRYAAPGQSSLRWGFGESNVGELPTATVAMTTAQMTGPGSYRWTKLGKVELEAGPNVFILGQGGLRPDCFLLVADENFEPTDDLLEEAAFSEAQVTGPDLPPLAHDRKIENHPKWLKDAYRVCYSHFEDRHTPTSWARRAREAGATVLIGFGAVPAGMIDGKFERYPYSLISGGKDFEFPEEYDLSHDWTKEYVDRIHAEGLKAVLYGCAWCYIDDLLLENPEWRQRNAQGGYYERGLGSWHSPYREAYIARWVELARRSKFDGIMIDMVFMGPVNGDYSKWTVDAFKEKFGVDAPTEPDPRNRVWQRWIEFQQWSREDMLLDLTEALHEVDPEIAVIVNQTEGWIFSTPERNFLSHRVSECVDGLLEEMGWDFSHKWDRPWAWPASTAWQSLFLHCRTRPDGYGQMWHMILNFPQTHVEALSYSMLANGVAPAVVVGGNWPEMGATWQHIRKCEPWVDGRRNLVPWAAMVFSESTLDWHANAEGQDVYMAWMKNLFGVFQATLETHRPIEILRDMDIEDAATLEKYAVLILPNTACMSDRQAEAVKTYVRNGGGLVATYETGRYDEEGSLREKPALADLLGVEQYRAVQSSEWKYEIPAEGAGHPIMEHPDILNAGNWGHGLVEPDPTAHFFRGGAGRMVGAAPVSPPPPGAFSLPLRGAAADAPGVPDAAVMRALVAGQAGKGRAVLFPLDLGHAFYVYNHPCNRRFLDRALTWAASRPCPLETDAPMAVQTVLWKRNDSEALVCHLVNDNSSYGRAAAPNPEAWTAFRAESIPVHDITVSVKGEFGKATQLPEGRQLDVRRSDGRSTTTVPRMDIHTVIVWEP